MLTFEDTTKHYMAIFHELLGSTMNCVEMKSVLELVPTAHLIKQKARLFIPVACAAPSWLNPSNVHTNEAPY